MKLIKFFLPICIACLSHAYAQAPAAKDILIPQRGLTAPFDFTPKILNGITHAGQVLGFASNGDIIGLDVLSNGIVGPLTFTETNTPSASPPANQGFLYLKPDGLFYSMNEAGTETVVTGGGAAGINVSPQQFIYRTAAGSGTVDTPITIGPKFSTGGNILALAETYIAADSTITLTNKRIIPRVQVITANSGTVTINNDAFDIAEAGVVSGSMSFAPPTGAPQNGEMLTIILTSSPSFGPRTIFFQPGTPGFLGSDDMPLPTLTSGTGKTDIFKFMFAANKLPGAGGQWLFVGELKGF